MKEWPHRYLVLCRTNVINSGHGTIDEANASHAARQKRAGFRIDFGEVIDTWNEPGHQVAVTGDDGRVFWYKWEHGPSTTPSEDDPLGISQRFAAMELT